MRNYANDAVRPPTFLGDFGDVDDLGDAADAEADAVPDWIAWVNFGFSVGALALLVTAIVVSTEIVSVPR